MFGVGDEFEYFECAECGCLQRAGALSSPARYYPAGYYSFTAPAVCTGGIRARIAGVRDRAVAQGRVWARLLGEPPTLASHLAAIGSVAPDVDVRIIDVGAGNGLLLALLARAGFTRLLGVDPYLRADQIVAGDVRVLARELADVAGEFDLVMLHHVLEHVDDQHGLMREVRRLLAVDGRVLVRAPTVDSAAWERYGEHWVQLDAPRHAVLHTESSLRILAERNGFRVVRVYRDSDSFQFWASELYRRGVPLVRGSAGFAAPLEYFSPSELAEFDAEARRLNAAQRGDQFVALLALAD
jgi:SAM-dependent methyltransferase